MLRSLLLPCEERAHRLHPRLMSLQLTARYQKLICPKDRVALLNAIHPVKATLLHKPRFVALYSGMMSKVVLGDFA